MYWNKWKVLLKFYAIYRTNDTIYHQRIFFKQSSTDSTIKHSGKKCEFKLNLDKENKKK